MKLISSALAVFRALAAIRNVDLPRDALDFADVAYNRCSEWFGIPSDGDWEYSIKSGLFTACHRLASAKQYCFTIQDSTLNADRQESLLFTIGHEMYHRVTWSLDGLRATCWVDELMADCTAAVLLEEAGHRAFIEAAERSYRAGARIRDGDVGLQRPRRDLSKIEEGSLPMEFRRSVFLLGRALKLLVGWDRLIHLPGSDTWGLWLEGLPTDLRPVVEALLGPIDADMADVSQGSGSYILSPRQNVRLANAQYIRGNYDVAINKCQDAVRLEPKSVKAYQILGCAFDALSQPDAALEAFERASSLRPEEPEFHMRLCNLHLNAGRWTAAHEAYTSASSLVGQGTKHGAYMSKLRKLLDASVCTEQH